MTTEAMTPEVPGATEDKASEAAPEASSRPDRKELSVAEVETRLRRRRKWLVSPLTLRIMAINLLALAMLVGGVFYVDEYRRSLIVAELQNMRLQAELLAGALGATVVQNVGDDSVVMSPDLARQLVRRFEPPPGVRIRVFLPTGELAADSRMLRGPYGVVQIEPLPPIGVTPSLGERALNAVYDWIVGWLPADERLPPYREAPMQTALDYPEAVEALQGEAAYARRRLPEGRMHLSVGVPVQSYRQVLGALVISGTDKSIEENIRAVRLDIMKVFALVFAVTALLSFYLARTITRPIERLAAAAERLRLGMNRQHKIPDFRKRRDEIGELSGTLIAMTDALWQRLDAIERFAADVSHEIKNPLTSLRSAVETASRVKDAERQQKLMAVILDDVKRLDRLISDISDASRLDSELSRADMETVDVGIMLSTLVGIYTAVPKEDGPRFKVKVPSGDKLLVKGLESRLGQVVRNLVTNAISFSPPGGMIAVSGSRQGNYVVFTVEDEGPGIPENKLADIFNRFYTERPKGERFGTHSGLGLSISKQIVDAHGGTVTAENRKDADGKVLGARFTVRLPKQ